LDFLITMAIEIRRKPDEPINVFLYRFNKQVQQSGVLGAVKKARFFASAPNRRQRRASAIYRAKIRKDILYLKKAGVLKGAEDIKFIKKLLRNPKKQSF